MSRYERISFKTRAGNVIDLVHEPESAQNDFYVLFRHLSSLVRFVGEHRVDQNMAQVLVHKGWLCKTSATCV